MLKDFLAVLRRILTGRELTRAIDRNQRAADDLDGALREVLRR